MDEILSSIFWSVFMIVSILIGFGVSLYIITIPHFYGGLIF